MSNASAETPFVVPLFQTLIHYDVEAWEGRAYEYGVEALRQQGVPVDGLKFDSSLVIRG